MFRTVMRINGAHIGRLGQREAGTSVGTHITPSRITQSQGPSIDVCYYVCCTYGTYCLSSCVSFCRYTTYAGLYCKTTTHRHYVRVANGFADAKLSITLAW